MKYTEVAIKIKQICEDNHLSFSDRGNYLLKEMDSCSNLEILEHIEHAGIIPECFDHDSTEEKVFAKYCDILLAKALAELGLNAEVINARGEAADVLAWDDGNVLVGDAKAFRLSRTAKNQKDFKVESLNQWRKGDNYEADYALLVAPHYQYPNTRSQIYQQAIRYNVTLLSYTHLAFLIRQKNDRIMDLNSLWNVGKTLTPDNDASKYWNEIHELLLDITGKNNTHWKQEIKIMFEILKNQVIEQVEYLEGEKKKIKKLDHDIAVNELIKALKINEKISTIRKCI